MKFKNIRVNYNCGYLQLESGALVEADILVGKKFNHGEELENILDFLSINGFRQAFFCAVQKRAVGNSFYALFNPDDYRTNSELEIVANRTGKNLRISVYAHGLLSDSTTSRIVSLFQSRYHLN